MFKIARFFRWKQKSDALISLALMAYHRGASIRGIQNTVKEFFLDEVCAECIIKWKREEAGKVCKICFHSKYPFCSKRGLIVSQLEGKCKFFSSKLLSAELFDKVLQWFITSYKWRPYGKVGHPNKLPLMNHKTTKNVYCRKYYRAHPKYAKTLLVHPENLYNRIKLRELTEEERKERKKKQHREWARKKKRKERGDKFNEEMSRRGKVGAEKKYNRKYDDHLSADILPS